MVLDWMRVRVDREEKGLSTVFCVYFNSESLEKWGGILKESESEGNVIKLGRKYIWNFKKKVIKCVKCWIG